MKHNFENWFLWYWEKVFKSLKYEFEMHSEWHSRLLPTCFANILSDFSISLPSNHFNCSRVEITYSLYPLKSVQGFPVKNLKKNMFWLTNKEYILHSATASHLHTFPFKYCRKKCKSTRSLSLFQSKNINKLFLFPVEGKSSSNLFLFQVENVKVPQNSKWPHTYNLFQVPSLSLANLLYTNSIKADVSGSP